MPVHRIAARVLPVSSDGEALLLQGRDPARPDDLHWVAIGGAVEPGESLVDAVLRELVEETGITATATDLTVPVHAGDYAFSWGGVDYLSRSTFFAMPLERGVCVSFAGLEPGEIGNLLRAAWWNADDLAADGSAASPDLPDIIRAAVAAVEGDT